MFSPIRSALRRSAQASRRHAHTQAPWTQAQRRGYAGTALAAVGVALSASAALGAGKAVRLDAGDRAEPWAEPQPQPQRREAGEPAEGGDAPHVREGEGEDEGEDAGTADGEGEGEGGGGPHAGGAYNPETGEINWDCPCLGGMAHGPCGQAFRDAFACFVFSAAEPKGVDCVARFAAMQDCFRAHPEVYGEEIMADDDDDEDDVPSSADSPEREGEPAPTPAPETPSPASP